MKKQQSAPFFSAIVAAPFGANRFPLIIPCHRVTAAGALGGFAHHADAAGFHVGVKRWLLSDEGAGSYR